MSSTTWRRSRGSRFAFAMVTETKAAKVFKDLRLIVSYELDPLRYGLGALAPALLFPVSGLPALGWALGTDRPVPRIAMEAASGEDRHT